MITILILFYSTFYYLFFVKTQWLAKTKRNISAFIGVGVVIIGGIVIYWYTFSPISPDARVVRYVIPIVPDVKGKVTEVYVQAMVPLKKGDKLFQIEKDVYQYSVQQIEAQVKQFKAEEKLANLNLKRADELAKTQSVSQENVDRWQKNKEVAVASIEAAEAALENANWQLTNTTVLAPHDGFVANLQLRPGNHVTTVVAGSPMAFVSNEASPIIASFSQSSIRKIKVGNSAEIVFSTVPGEVFTGKVTEVIKLSSEAQLTATSTLPTLTGAPVTNRWAVKVILDDEAVAKSLPQGAGGMMAVYTRDKSPVNIISKVTVRMKAYLAYLTNPK